MESINQIVEDVSLKLAEARVRLYSLDERVEDWDSEFAQAVDQAHIKFTFAAQALDRILLSL